MEEKKAKTQRSVEIPVDIFTQILEAAQGNKRTIEDEKTGIRFENEQKGGNPEAKMKQGSVFSFDLADIVAAKYGKHAKESKVNQFQSLPWFSKEVTKIIIL